MGKAFGVLAGDGLALAVSVVYIWVVVWGIYGGDAMAVMVVFFAVCIKKE